MKSTKKLIAVILSVFMMMSMMLCANAVTFSDVDSTHNRYTAITTLANMGIINGYTDGTFKPDNAVTRAEMAKMVSLVFNYGLNTVTQSPFSDVETDHWAISYISTMKDVGIINGFPDGTFLPSGEVTYEQAIKMIVCALNWGEVAVQSSTSEDWSLGYRSMASKLGVTKFVSVSNNSEPATRSIIAQLLYNSLDVKPAVKNEDGSYSQSDKPLKDQVTQSLSFENAQIITTPKMNLDPTNYSIQDGHIRVKLPTGAVHTMSVGNNTNVYDNIGRYGSIIFAPDSNGDYVLTSFIVKGTETTLDIKNIESIDASSISYYADENYEKTSKFTVNNPTVIYNNRALKVPTDFVTLLTDAIKTTTSDGTALNFFGSLKFVEHNSGDLIVINSYKSYEAESVDSKTYKVKLKGLNSELYMPVKDAPDYEIVKKTTLGGSGTSATSLSIPAGSIVTVSKSYTDGNGSVGDTKYIEYFVNNSSSSITPTGTEQLTSRPYFYKKITANSKDYYVANKEAGDKIVVGATSTYLTDASGDIVLVKSFIDKSKRVGLFMNGSKNDNDDTTNVTFYDPVDAATFTVTIQDKNDVTTITNNMNSGALFWMNITNNTKVTSGNIKVITNGESYETLSSVKVYDGTGKTVKKTGSTYNVTGDTSYSANSYNVKVFVRPDDMATLNKFTYSSFSMSADLSYKNPKVISFKKDDKSYMVMWINPYKDFLDNSPMYVVKEIDPIITKNDEETQIQSVICYDYKSGTGDKTIKFEANVLNTLALEMGDVFTYYSDCSTKDVQIDKTSNVRILVRASKLAANKTFADSMTDRVLAETNGSYVWDADGYKKYAIYQSDISATYYNYILTTPVHFSNENDGSVLYLSKKGVSTLLLDDFKSLLSGAVGDNWTIDNIKTALNGKMIDVDLTKCKSVFVYDIGGSTDEEKFYKLEEVNNDTLGSLFGEVNTLFKGDAPADEAGISAKAKNSAMVYTYFSNNDASLNTLYVIK